MDEDTNDRYCRSSGHDNDLNAANPRAGGGFLSVTVKADLRAELMRRGLPQHGTKEELHERLSADDKLIQGLKGRHKVHKRKLQVMKAEKVARENVPFHEFSNLPLEIQLIVWECSLPGPRVLSVSDIRKKSAAMLHFRKYDNEPNPIALSVCQASRKIALRKYRLCFGTPNVYADLSTDILYFGSHWRTLDTFMRDWTMWTYNIEEAMRAPNTMPYAVIQDLKKVKHLALRHRIWKDFLQRRVGVYAGVLLRRQLMKWAGLRKLILVHGDKEDEDGLFSLTPGYIFFKDASPCQNPDLKLLQRGFHLDDTFIRDHFLTIILSGGYKQEENRLDLPRVHFVNQQRVTVVPDDDWERDYGIPYHIPEALQNPFRRPSPSQPSSSNIVDKMSIAYLCH